MVQESEDMFPGKVSGLQNKMMKRRGMMDRRDSLRLLGLDRSRYATPGQHQTGQQCHLHAVGLAIAHAEAAEPVLPPAGLGQRAPIDGRIARERDHREGG